MREPHLCHIASFLSFGRAEFQALMRHALNEDELVRTASKYVIDLLSQRAASFSRHDAPPFASWCSRRLSSCEIHATGPA